jgi:predicted O-methyltransferase YrrM
MQRPLIDFPAPPFFDPIADFVRCQEFDEAKRYFADYPATSLLYNGGVARTFVYLLIRSLRVKSVLEIGTYLAGTTEVIARALWANGGGHVDTVDPSGYPHITAALAEWPEDLRALCTFHNVNSMTFFHGPPRRYDLAFVDGDHDHEVALFDIQRSAALLNRGGHLLVDDAEQPGVRAAALRFIQENEDWRLLGPEGMAAQSPIQRLDDALMSVPETAFWLLRAPEKITLANRLVCAPLAPFSGITVRGLRMRLAPGSATPKRGAVHYRTSLQAIPNFELGLKPIELVAVGEIDVGQIENEGDCAMLRFPSPIEGLMSEPRASEYLKMVETYITYLPLRSQRERFDLADLPKPIG